MGENKVFDQAWVTLATNNQYALGALALGHSLKTVGTTRQLVVMVTPGVTQPMRNELGKVFSEVVPIDVMDSKDTVNLALIERPDLGVTFSKLHCWRLTQYKKCVFMDADTLVLQNSDELFERPQLAAAPDIGWPDNFNTGVFVFDPSEQTYELLLAFALQNGSYDGGDQGLLNAYFADWYKKDISYRLPFIYNCSASVFYTYKAAFKRYLAEVKIVHFLGAVKPWHYTYDAGSGRVLWRSDGGHSLEHLQMWWQICAALVMPQLASGELPDLINGNTLVGPYAEVTVRSGSKSPSASRTALQIGPSACAESPSGPAACAESPFVPAACAETREEVSSPTDESWVTEAPLADQRLAGLTNQLQQVEIAPTITEEDRRRAWEQGRPDVTNMDSFAAIQRHMEEQIGGGKS